MSFYEPEEPEEPDEFDLLEEGEDEVEQLDAEEEEALAMLEPDEGGATPDLMELLGSVAERQEQRRQGVIQRILARERESRMLGARGRQVLHPRRRTKAELEMEGFIVDPFVGAVASVPRHRHRHPRLPRRESQWEWFLRGGEVPRARVSPGVARKRRMKRLMAVPRGQRRGTIERELARLAGARAGAEHARQQLEYRRQQLGFRSGM